jgi:NAD(P)-dependent dehydrogenase (short-subunit alcohol dehydrogenase family)
MDINNLEVQFDAEIFKKTMDLDFNTIFYLIKYSYKELSKGGCGSIINIASAAAYRASGPVAYTAAKGAIKTMTIVLGQRFSPIKIRINTIYPGLIETELMRAGLDGLPEIKAAVLKTIPMGRIGKEEEIASGVLFLASNASSYMTGQDMVIDGGQTC